jgi:hypothetical protein
LNAIRASQTNSLRYKLLDYTLEREVALVRSIDFRATCKTPFIHARFQPGGEGQGPSPNRFNGFGFFVAEETVETVKKFFRALQHPVETRV